MTTTTPALTDPFIFKVLDISTGHMTEDDNTKLAEGLGRLPVSELNEYGYLVYIGELEENWDHMSDAFKNVLLTARAHGCEYVRFDADGRAYDELPVFDW